MVLQHPLDDLLHDGLVERPVTFTANKLALIVPKANPAGIRSVSDLRIKPVKLIVAGADVPVGAYTRTVLRRMGLLSVLAKVVSQEPDVRSVLTKVALGEADAGFVYRTDAATVKNDVNVIKLPAWAQPPVRYGICVVSASSNKAGARTFITKVLGKTGRKRLTAAGFGVPTAKK